LKHGNYYRKKIGKTLEDRVISNYVLNRTPIAQEIRARIDKWDCIELKSFCTSKETITRTRDNPQNGRKFLLAIPQIRD
jgi:hypothetical protein